MFPDKDYMRELVRQLRAKVEAYQADKPTDQLVMYSGAAMNWLGDYLTDEAIKWELKELLIDELRLSGTNPDWNEIVIDRCERSPKKLREMFRADADVIKRFQGAVYKPIPILVRYENGEYRVLDGMKRTIAAIRDGRETIQAYVATQAEKSRPVCEPHVVYDMLRAYERGLSADRAGLVAALRFLRESYANVEDLLRNRFSDSWVHNKELQVIIKEVID